MQLHSEIPVGGNMVGIMLISIIIYFSVQYSLLILI